MCCYIESHVHGCVRELCLCCCIQAFNPDNEYHFKNRMKACQRNWAEVFGDEANMFAVSLSNSYQKVRESLLLSLFCAPVSYFVSV